VRLGDTFIWSPDRDREPHLYIIVTDPTKNGGKIVVFNLTKSKGGPKALTLKKGDHPFIRKYDSDVNFGDGLITSVTEIQSEIASGRAVLREPMHAEIVRRIAKFAKGHPAVSQDAEAMIIAEWKL
jgi:hypothetical protein